MRCSNSLRKTLSYSFLEQYSLNYIFLRCFYVNIFLFLYL